MSFASCLRGARLGAVLLMAAVPASLWGAPDFVIEYSNMHESWDNDSAVETTSYVAQSFLTGNIQSQFSFVELRMGVSTSHNESFLVSIYNTVSNAPGTRLMDLTGNSSPMAPGVIYPYLENTPPLDLAPNTRYWVVAHALTVSGYYSWAYTTSGNHSGNWTTTDTLFSEDQGATWDVAAFSPRQQMTIGVRVASVPEPAAWAIVPGAAVLGLAAYRRRKTLHFRR